MWCCCKGSGIGLAEADNTGTNHDFMDAQAAVRRIASEEHGLRQQYALQARTHIAMRCKARPGIIIETRWCPAHKGVTGNEKADEWAKIAAEEPNARGVGWLSCSGRSKAREMPHPRSLGHLKREISEKKWVEARQWPEGRTSKIKHRMPKARGRTARMPGALRGSPHGSTS